MLAQTNSFKQKVKKSIYAPEYTDKRYVEEYLNFHKERFARTANLIKGVIKPTDKVVDLGTYGCLVPVFKDIFGLTDITCTLDLQENALSHESTILHNASKGEQYPFIRDRFNLESPFPYPNDTFDIVAFTEVLEHLTVDPMYTLSEINRISKSGAHLVLSTPNCASSLSFYKILRGQNPFIFPHFIKDRSTDRHNREYTFKEVKSMIETAGYKILYIKAINVYYTTWKKQAAVSLIEICLMLLSFLTFGIIQGKNRGDTILVLARKQSAMKERHPDFLYYP